jgi:hypothetical protein
MAYICLDCGHIFEEGEQKTRTEERGEYWGTSCSVSIGGCPNCGGEYEEATSCSICGSKHLEEDLNGGLCDECIDKYKHNIDMCFKVGSGDTEAVKINCFLAAMFDEKEIEELLFDRLKKRNGYIKEYIELDCEKFVNSDRSWFGERLLEELEKEKK